VISLESLDKPHTNILAPAVVALLRIKSCGGIEALDVADFSPRNSGMFTNPNRRPI
jgi:hypothetical protein